MVEMAGEELGTIQPGARGRSLGQRMKEVTKEYAPLAFITFGGPAAHIGILHERFVVQRKWLDDKMFVEFFAICSGLPGPASTQMAYTVALIRDGLIPGIWAYFLWAVPGAIVMTACGVAVGGSGALPTPVLFLENGLASAAIALVALAAYNLGNKICKDHMSKIIAVITICFTINYEDKIWLIPCLMVFGGLVAIFMHVYDLHKAAKAEGLAKKDGAVTGTATASDKAAAPPKAVEEVGMDGAATVTAEAADPEAPPADERKEDAAGGGAAAAPNSSVKAVANGASTTSVKPAKEANTVADHTDVAIGYSVRTGCYILVFFFACFIAAIVTRAVTNRRGWDILSTFFYVGSIIFGGGPVVIPLLYNYIVSPGWADDTEFLLGLAIINAMPGPNFNFAAYCGAISVKGRGIGAQIGAAFLAWVGIFAPGLLIQTGILPIWRAYRGLPLMQVVFKGFNAAAVGLVFTATFLLWEKAISINNSGSTEAAPYNLGDYPLYVAVLAVVFVAVGFIKVPAPFAIMAAGAVGLFDWLAWR